MCHSPESSPPIAPLAGAAVEHQDIALQSADGAKFAAFAARSDNPTGAGIVILPDVRGLYRFYEELALRFAEQGINAVAIDYFGRTAGVGKRGDDFKWSDEMAHVKTENVAADVRAAVEYLRSPDGGSCRSIFTVGFCFGGSNSWLQAANGHGLAGVIGFYGRPTQARDGAPGPIDRASEFRAPVLALMGGADQGITVDQVDAYREALQRAGVEHDVVVYPGAPHSFFDRLYTEHAEASADAWERVLAFIRKHSS